MYMGRGFQAAKHIKPKSTDEDKKAAEERAKKEREQYDEFIKKRSQ